MFYDIYLYTLCYYICCLLGACMRCTRLCPLKPGVTHVVEHTTHHAKSRTGMATLPTLAGALSLSPSLSRDACNPYYEHPGVRKHKPHLPLVFHLASTHLGRDTQQQIYWSVDGPRGSETPTDSQEEFLIKENKKHVKVKNAYAEEAKKNKNLTKELSICHDTISNLRTENASLIAKVEKLNACNDSIDSLRNENDNLVSKIKELNVCNDSISCLRDENAILNAKIEELKSCKPSTSTVEHVSICTRCRDVNVEAIHDHLALIKQQNDHIAQLTAKINEHEIDNKKFKFARSMLYNGRRLGIKDGIGFQQGSNVKINAPKRLSNFVKGKAPMIQDNEGYILYPANYLEHKFRRIHAKKSHSVSHHVFLYKNEASSSR
jgi:prefoldin subunit 5